jgi:hypothetical protein
VDPVPDPLLFLVVSGIEPGSPDLPGEIYEAVSRYRNVRYEERK